ncbi:MAG: 30S ribosomal protein S20 [Fidelibacterota bacterium]|nr:MAG: 30S ribosomal protein S20 [Candidatus Neomarinimicrobiota bacterium]
MDRHKSTIKRHRQSLKRNERNRVVKSRMKTYIRKVEEATSKETAETALLEAISALDKTAGSRIIHRNKAARIKSRLTHLVASRFAS